MSKTTIYFNDAWQTTLSAVASASSSFILRRLWYLPGGISYASVLPITPGRSLKGRFLVNIHEALHVNSPQGQSRCVCLVISG